MQVLLLIISESFLHELSYHQTRMKLVQKEKLCPLLIVSLVYNRPQTPTQDGEWLYVFSNRKDLCRKDS